ncbi:excisionase [Klebsiella sp. JB_Kp036]|uniref:excisionase n=1 Tax=Klebsiella sp. JB_Kp036 TaxID=3153388 RepID=UPI0032B4407E
MAKLLTLEEWASRTYETPPSLSSLRRWAREGRIYPAPELHGKTYRVHPDAVYVDISKKALVPNRSIDTITSKGTLVERVRAMEQKQVKKRR